MHFIYPLIYYPTYWVFVTTFFELFFNKNKNNFLSADFLRVSEWCFLGNNLNRIAS